MRKLIFLLALSSLSALIASCTERKPINKINGINVLIVSDYDFTMNSKQAVSIIFGESNSNYCSVTIYRDSIKPGYLSTSRQKSVTDLSLDCNWDGENYLQSSKHPTSANINIVRLDSVNKTAEIKISLHLVNPSSDKYFTLKDISLVLNEDKFANLVKKIP